MSGNDEGFLARWSRRKREEGAESRSSAAPPADARPVDGEAALHGAPVAAGAPAKSEPAPLPPLESLTPRSDFAPFMRAEVDPGAKGRALKTLFSDPALYPMDGLDVYIDDYTKPDPMPLGWLEKLNQFATLHGEPPAQAQEEVADLSPPTSGGDAASEPELPAPSDTSAESDAPADPKNRGAI